MDYQFKEKLEAQLKEKINEGYKYYNMANAVSNINPYSIGKK